MPLMLAGLALMIRSIVLRIYRAKTGKVDPLHAAVEAHVPLNQPPTGACRGGGLTWPCWRPAA